MSKPNRIRTHHDGPPDCPFDEWLAEEIAEFFENECSDLGLYASAHVMDPAGLNGPGVILHTALGAQFEIVVRERRP